MLGEMRDHETAAIGVEASLTGHLVFSTLHTNSAPETVTRLLEMDIEPFNFADSRSSASSPPTNWSGGFAPGARNRTLRPAMSSRAWWRTTAAASGS